jgi:exodeoxyribonuclease VII large subunit
LQLVVHGMSRCGQGALFEQFLRLKAKLEGEGLFDAARKRALPLMPRGIGVVTSLGAAAWHDVVTALRRRAPHVPVILAPASVQGAGAPAELAQALQRLFALTPTANDGADQPDHDTATASRNGPLSDVILLVRGGGSLEDLWAFNDENLARVIASSPVPVVSGVGHETDFSIADFVADLRAPTPTAAAELVARPRAQEQAMLDQLCQAMQRTVARRLDAHGQRIDQAATRLGRPSALVSARRVGLDAQANRLRTAAQFELRRHQTRLIGLRTSAPGATQRRLDMFREQLANAQLRLDLLDPKLVLARGYAWLSTPSGQPVASVRQLSAGQALTATLADGEVDLTVANTR